MSLTSKTASRPIRNLRAVLVAVLASTATVSEAALLALSDSPLYLLTPVEPNILLTFDDSGSMAWAFLPDTISGLSGAQRGCSSEINKVYFDPAQTYLPPVRADGSPLNATPTSFTAAYRDGFNTGSGTVNLDTGYQPSWGDLTSYGTCGQAVPSAAFYFNYDPSGTGCSPAVNTNNNCYTKVTVTSASAEAQNFANWYSYYRNRNLTAKTAAGRAFQRFGTNVRIGGQHLNNTAAGTGSGIRFTNSSTNILMRRFCDDPSNTDPSCTDGSTARTDFFTRLYNSPRSGGTPLRAAMRRAGDHFGSGNTGANSPYRDVPGSSASPERSCRQNFHVLMTDGYWNSDTGVVGNTDGTGQTLPDGTAFTGSQPPYSDSWSGSLADNSFYYWYRDLRSDLGNNVRTRFSVGDATTDYWNPANDPANWQHMVSFTIGLGIAGTLNPANYLDTSLPATAGDYDELLAGTLGWPDPISNTQGQRIDDLWHAALNSRGRYFSASNPDALINAFNAIVTDITAAISSASAAALNSGAMTTNTYVYQAKFDSGNWTGQLLSYYINPATATVETNPTWDAGAVLNDSNIASNVYNNRLVLTYKPSNAQGIPFRWPSNPASPTATELDTNQSTALNYNPLTAAYDTAGQARLDYLRGEARHESDNPSPPTPFYNFRARDRMCGAIVCSPGTKPNTGVLGDIINSAPVFVGTPPMSYPDTLEAASYSAFRSAYDNRQEMIYVGANDGMLHGFDASNGREQLAYVPSEVYGNLSRLTAVPYGHRYFVDGSPVVADVFINGAWRTILVGGLRKGGQGIFALDITDPGAFSEANANNVVLWEFNDSNDADLGYTYGDPVIAKMQNGRWAVILSGGYNNDEADGTVGDGSAALYILFIEDGMGLMGARWSNVIKIDTGVGSATVRNGMASPAAVDVDGDFKVDYIYAGDLRGNMWRFDVTSTSPAAWDNAANRKAIYVAKDSSNILQPITARPQVGPHPAGYPGNVVYFGTGKYLETTDASIVGATTQTFYTIWDESGVTNPSRSNLLQQTITGVEVVSGIEYRASTNEEMIWRTGPPYPNPSYIGWYMDLPDAGERSVTDPLLLDDGRIIFTTAVPSDDPCEDGGDGWFMVLDAASGSRLTITPFDVNRDNRFDNGDFIAVGGGTGAASGRRFGGIPSSPTILLGGNPAASPACTGAKCSEQGLISTTGGDLTGEGTNAKYCSYCRASWRQIR